MCVRVCEKKRERERERERERILLQLRDEGVYEPRNHCYS